MTSVIDEIPQLISDSDLHITQLAMQLTSLMIQQSIAVGIKGLLNDILPNVYLIVRSPLLQGKLNVMLVYSIFLNANCYIYPYSLLILPLGGALNAVLHFFHILVATSDTCRKQGDESAVSFRDVLRSLIEPIYPQRSSKQRVSSPQSSTSTTTLHKQAFHSTGKG